MSDENESLPSLSPEDRELVRKAAVEALCAIVGVPYKPDTRSSTDRTDLTPPDGLAGLSG